LGENHIAIHLQFGNEVLPLPEAGMRMEVGRVGITLLDPTDGATHARNSALKGSECQAVLLEAPTQPSFQIRERSEILSNIQLVE
jgi:hypothetical protein